MSKDLNKWKKRKSEGQFPFEQTVQHQMSNNWFVNSLSFAYQRTLGFLTNLLSNQYQTKQAGTPCKYSTLYSQLRTALNCGVTPNGGR